MATLLVSVPLFAAASVNVTASHLDILESPSATAPVLGQLKAGDKVVVESCAEDFCEILGDVDSGYETAFVSKRGLIPRPASETPQAESAPESSEVTLQEDEISKAEIEPEEVESSEAEECISEGEPEEEKPEISESENSTKSSIGVGGALLLILGLILFAIVGSSLLRIWIRFSGDRDRSIF